MEPVNAMRLDEGRLSCCGLRMLNLFEEAAKAPCAVGKQ